jgi:hypothetical protein
MVGANAPLAQLPRGHPVVVSLATRHRTASGGFSPPYSTTSITDIMPKSSWARMWQW